MFSLNLSVLRVDLFSSTLRIPLDAISRVTLVNTTTSLHDEALFLFLQWAPHLSLMSSHGQSYIVTVRASAVVNNRVSLLTLAEA